MSCLILLAVLVGTGIARGELTVNYEVTIRGVEDRELLQLLESVSNTVTYKDKPPATISLLEHRAKTDIPALVQALRSSGYYSAEVDVSIDENSDPPLVIFQIAPGPVYVLESVTIERASPTGVEAKLPLPEEIGLILKQPARARAIVDARQKLIENQRRQGFAFARAEEQKVVVDHGTRGVRVTFVIDPGVRAPFGPTTISGLESVEEKFVRGLLHWREGDRFDPELMNQAQKRLVESRLFSLVMINHADRMDESGRVPISIQLKERHQRSISAGLFYKTDEGPGAKVTWEHRNLLSAGESLKLDIAASGFGYSGEATFKNPMFLRNDQTLLFSNRLANDDTNAFDSRNLNSGVVIEREPRKGLRFGLGPEFRLSRVKLEADPLGIEHDFALVSLRSYLNWDTTDNLLDPTRGGRLEVQLAPFVDTLDSGVSFFKGKTSYSRYFQVSERPNLILAGRGAIGTIAGAERDAVPADLRFYAGGGGSVRGYGFQLAGPVVGDNPLGGDSLLELSFELRTKITEKIGLVGFVDGGSAFESNYPDFKTSLLWGGGVGVRYFTPIGPLRLDVAIPINKREGVDDPFQIYLSIGQAF